MKTKKILFFFFLFPFFLFIGFLNNFFFPVLAQDSTLPARIRTREKIQAQTQEQIQEKIQEKIKERIQERTTLKNKMAKILQGEITAISGTTLTVKKDDKSYTIKTDDNTRFRRHFWGKSKLSEFSVGDKVDVWGIWTDDSQTTILAKMIRNLSLQKRYGVFFGTVKSKETSSFVLTTLKRGEQTVYFDSNTKFINRKGEKIAYDEIKSGDRIGVRGLWDRTLSKITEVKEVKDFSLPEKPTQSQ